MQRLKELRIKTDQPVSKISPKLPRMRPSAHQTTSILTLANRASICTIQTCQVCPSKLIFLLRGSLKSTNRFSTQLQTNSNLKYLIRCSKRQPSSQLSTAKFGRISTLAVRLRARFNLRRTIWSISFQHSLYQAAIQCKTQARSPTLCLSHRQVPTL